MRTRAIEYESDFSGTKLESAGYLDSDCRRRLFGVANDLFFSELGLVVKPVNFTLTPNQKLSTQRYYRYLLALLIDSADEKVVVVTENASSCWWGEEKGWFFNRERGEGIVKRALRRFVQESPNPRVDVFVLNHPNHCEVDLGDVLTEEAQKRWWTYPLDFYKVHTGVYHELRTTHGVRYPDRTFTFLLVDNKHALVQVGSVLTLYVGIVPSMVLATADLLESRFK